MSGITELIRTEKDGSLSFGNYELESKGKVSDYEFDGDIYKVKTYKDITRLEKNEVLAYESVPGTVVRNYKESEDKVTFSVEGIKDTQVILAVEDDAEYSVSIDGKLVETYESNLPGKLVVSLELEPGIVKELEVKKV